MTQLLFSFFLLFIIIQLVHSDDDFSKHCSNTKQASSGKAVDDYLQTFEYNPNLKFDYFYKSEDDSCHLVVQCRGMNLCYLVAQNSTMNTLENSIIYDYKNDDKMTNNIVICEETLQWFPLGWSLPEMPDIVPYNNEFECYVDIVPPISETTTTTTSSTSTTTTTASPTTTTAAATTTTTIPSTTSLKPETTSTKSQTTTTVLRSSRTSSSLMSTTPIFIPTTSITSTTLSTTFIPTSSVDPSTASSVNPSTTSSEYEKTTTSYTNSGIILGLSISLGVCATLAIIVIIILISLYCHKKRFRP